MRTITVQTFLGEKYTLDVTHKVDAAPFGESIVLVMATEGMTVPRKVVDRDCIELYASQYWWAEKYTCLEEFTEWAKTAKVPSFLDFLEQRNG